MSLLPWINYTDRMVGKGHPSFADTLNAALRGTLSQSGYAVDANPFAGLRDPVFNLKAFGAAIDGVTDDTAAWNAAYTAAAAVGGGTLISPTGTSIVSAWPAFTAPVVVMGQMGNLSKVHFTGTGTCCTFNYPSANPYQYGPGLRDITLDGTGSGGTQIGVVGGGANGCHGMYWENVQLQNFGTGLKWGDNAFINRFQNCMFRANGTQLLGPSGVVNSGENMCFVGVTFSNANPLGADISNPAGSPFNYRFIGCSFDNAQVAIASGAMAFLGCHFENPGAPGNYEFLVQTGGDVYLYHPTFRMNDVRSVNQFVHVTSGQLSAFGTRASAQSAGMPQVYFADTASTLLLFGTTVLSNVNFEFAESGFHTATYVGSWGCLNGFGNTNVVSADQGDASTVFTYGASPSVINFNTPLTAGRTYTLNHAGTCAGARVRVKRTANATGASTLTVQNQVPTALKVLAVGQWADFVFNGVSNAWEEEAFGSL